MRQAVKAGLAWALAAGLPLAGFAQDAVIRIEAKRGAEAAAEAAAAWAREFDDVVTFPLARGWVAIGLGPQTSEEAAARLGELTAARRIPADSFVAQPEGVELAPVGGTDTTQPQPEAAEPQAGNPSLAAGAVEGQGSDLLGPDGIVIDAPDGDRPGSVEESVAGARMDAAPQPAAEPAAEPLPAPGLHIRLQTVAGLPEAETALAEWRARFPEASLWRIPSGRHAIALGPLEDATATAWLAAFREGGAVPRDAFTSDSAELGELIDAGADPDLPAPGAAEDMPPLDQVQRALRWAGHYDGEIDGKTGPRTRAAIAAEVANLRLSPDAGTAMRLLIERRAAWRDQMGLTELRDDHTGLSVIAPMQALDFDRTERALSIYGPKDGSGAALILFSQPGGQQELLDISGLVTALGWVPRPERSIAQGHVVLAGADEAHIGRAEGWVRDGRAEGYVLIWPAADGDDQARIAAELSDSLTRIAAAANEAARPGAPALP